MVCRCDPVPRGDVVLWTSSSRGMIWEVTHVSSVSGPSGSFTVRAPVGLGRGPVSVDTVAGVLHMYEPTVAVSSGGFAGEGMRGP